MLYGNPLRYKVALNSMFSITNKINQDTNYNHKYEKVRTNSKQ